MRQPDKRRIRVLTSSLSLRAEAEHTDGPDERATATAALAATATVPEPTLGPAATRACPFRVRVAHQGLRDGPRQASRRDTPAHPAGARLNVLRTNSAHRSVFRQRTGPRPRAGPQPHRRAFRATAQPRWTSRPRRLPGRAPIVPAGGVHPTTRASASSGSRLYLNRGRKAPSRRLARRVDFLSTRR